MSTTITRNQFLQLQTLSANDPKLQALLKNLPLQKAFDSNKDGKIDLKDFDTNGDGKIDKQELAQLFNYIDSFDKNKSSHSFANKGIAGDLYKATKDNAQRFASASYREEAKIASQPLLSPQQQKAVDHAYSKLKNDIAHLSPKQQQEIRAKLQEMAANGQLDWLSNNKMAHAAQRFTLLQQIANPAQRDELAKLASDPRLTANNASPSSQLMYLQIAAKEGALAQKLLYNGTFSSLPPKEQQTIAMAILSSPALAENLQSASPSEIGSQIKSLQQDTKEFAKRVEESLGTSSRGDNYRAPYLGHAHAMLKEKPWLLQMLPAQTAQAFFTQSMRQLGEDKRIKEGMLALKGDNPTTYKLLFAPAFKEITKNALPNWSEHLVGFAASIGVSKLPLGVVQGTVAGAVNNAALAKTYGHSTEKAVFDVAQGLFHTALGLAKTSGTLITLLQTTLSVTADLIKNEKQQTALLNFFQQKENFALLP